MGLVAYLILRLDLRYDVRVAIFGGQVQGGRLFLQQQSRKIEQDDAYTYIVHNSLINSHGLRQVDISLLPITVNC